MGDNAALNRRSYLPARIVQDRHAPQAKQLLWETISAGDRYKMPLQEQQITRTIKKTCQEAEGETKTRYDAGAKSKTEKKEEKRGKEEQKQEQKWHRSTEAEKERRTRHDAQPRTEEQEEEANSAREKETEPNTDHAYQPVGSRAAILGKRLHEPAEEEERKSKITQPLSKKTSRGAAEQ